MNTSPNLWPTDRPTTYRAGYFFNPYYSQATVSEKVQAYIKISKFPKNFILSGDNIDTASDIEHIGGSQTPSWNVLFVDGHVQNVASTRVYQYFKNWGSANQNWGPFENVRYCLETLAANGNLDYITNNGLLGASGQLVWRHNTLGGETDAGHPAR
jgi:hypothetical protein